MKLKQNQLHPHLPLTSISDTAFLLLIFVMLISLSGTKKHSIDLPKSKSTLKETSQKSLNIVIKDDDILINNISTSGIKNKINMELEKQDKNSKIKIIAPKSIHFEKIKKILLILEKENLNNIEFAVKK